MNYKKLPYIVEAKSKDNQGYWLFNTWNKKIKFLNNVEYNNYNEDIIDAKKLEVLRRDSFLIDAKMDIEQIGKEIYQKECLSDKTLFVTIMPTLSCNFRCFYCYEDHVSIRMTSNMQKLVVESIIDRAGAYDNLRVEWFGGEPLLELETVINISTKLIAYCKNNKKSYIASMTTNGYLLSYEIYNILKKTCKVMYYQITIDGFKSEHDQSRPLISGAGTFDKIISNLKDIKNKEKSSFVEICIRTNYTASSILHRKEWEKYLCEEFLCDRRFKYIPKMAWNRNPNETNDKRYLPLRFGSSLLNLDDPTISHNNMIQLLYDLGLVSKGEVCYASKPNTVVIGPDGKLMKCTVHLKQSLNDIGYICSGGKFIIDPIKESYWVLKSVEKECLTCSIFPVCLAGAGCRHKFHVDQELCEKEKTNIIRHLEALIYSEINSGKMWV